MNKNNIIFIIFLILFSCYDHPISNERHSSYKNQGEPLSIGNFSFDEAIRIMREKSSKLLKSHLLKGKLISNQGRIEAVGEGEKGAHLLNLIEELIKRINDFRNSTNLNVSTDISSPISPIFSYL